MRVMDQFHAILIRLRSEEFKYAKFGNSAAGLLAVL
jgi:hypothetical protein